MRATRHDDVHLHRQPVGSGPGRRRDLRHRDRQRHRRTRARRLHGQVADRPDDPWRGHDYTSTSPSTATRRSSRTSFFVNVTNVTGANVRQTARARARSRTMTSRHRSGVHPRRPGQRRGHADPGRDRDHRGRRHRRLPGRDASSGASSSRRRTPTPTRTRRPPRASSSSAARVRPRSRRASGYRSPAPSPSSSA